MTYFLEKIASNLYSDFGERLDKHCLVFPNRRAGLYFLKYLSGLTGKPIWSPQIITINELFQLFSVKHLAESEIMVFALYNVYRELNPCAGTIDDFFFWGEMIINDFDDVDKYLVDQSRLFINLENIKDIETRFGGLTEEQVQIIRQFWVNFNPDSPTDQKKSFRELWSILLPLYNKFKDTLNSLGYAYEGMIYREVAEKCMRGEDLKIKWDKLHFVGFNALNTCEIKIMVHLKNMGYARFYWDYDDSFVFKNPSHSAGYFIRENLKIFGNDMPSDWDYNSSSSMLSHKPVINIIDCSSDTAQVKIASGLIESNYAPDKEKPHHTAVVLADENLIMPMLTSLPGNTEEINITMGYPLKFSPVYSLLRDLISLQSTARSNVNGEIYFNRDAVNALLNNSFIADSIELPAQAIIELKDSEQRIPLSYFTEKKLGENIFRKTSTAREQSLYLKGILESLYILSEKSEEDGAVVNGISLRNEFIFRVIMVINRLEAILGKGNPEISVQTYNKLFDRILRSLSIPFSGEPLSGIQIMGLLETRSLDFCNLIMLSVNEGILPQASASGSFIPFSLREAFKLPTIRHQDSIYSYYFYRLLQRAKQVTFIYNSSADGLRTGEKSRFLLQLEYSENPPVFSSHKFEIKEAARVPEEIIRTEEHTEILVNTYLKGETKALSPSAVNSWLTCTMKFYYSYLCGLRETRKVSSEVDSGMFGELLHLSMEKIYTGQKKKELDKSFFESLLKDYSKISLLVSEAIQEKLYNGKKNSLTGNDHIISNILISYIRQILFLDYRLLPLEIIEMEFRISAEKMISYQGLPVSITIGGLIDRLDRTNGKLRITDYKTGKVGMQIPSVESLFDENRKDRNESWLQLLMYCSIYKDNNPEQVIRPAIYPVRNMFEDDFNDFLSIKDLNGVPGNLNNFNDINMLFDSGLKTVIESIFSAERSFKMTENLRKCAFCPYKQLCQR